MIGEFFWGMQEMSMQQWFLVILGTALLVLSIVAGAKCSRGTTSSQGEKGAHPTPSGHLKAAGDFSFHSGQPFTGGDDGKIDQVLPDGDRGS